MHRGPDRFWSGHLFRMSTESLRLGAALVFSLGLHLLLGAVEGLGGAGGFGESTDSLTAQAAFGRAGAIEVAFRSSVPEVAPIDRPPVLDLVSNAPATPAGAGKSTLVANQADEVAFLPKPPKPDVPPVLRGKIELAFPEDPLLAILGGEAAFLISIDDIGRVVALAVETSSLPVPLQSAAERALLKARFIPAMRDGYYVPSQMRWQVTITPEVGLELQAVGRPKISTGRE